ncbi:MAG: hypothetical protein ACE5OY_04575 [Candidatus Bathyarchaeia archaeon]
MDQAKQIALAYLSSLNDPDLGIDEIMEFELNFYAIYYEKSTGIGAFEMLVDRYSGDIYPEPGPNMMWNTKYGGMVGHMGGGPGMMGYYQGTPTADMPVSEGEAIAYAQEYLNTALSGSTAEDVHPFYGYYTIHVVTDGEIYGMLSVNGYTGKLWYHGWHGTFIGEEELHH